MSTATELISGSVAATARVGKTYKHTIWGRVVIAWLSPVIPSEGNPDGGYRFAKMRRRVRPI